MYLGPYLITISSFFVFYLFISACTCVCAHVYMCVWGGDLGLLCVYGGQKRVSLEFLECGRLPGLLCEYSYLNFSLLVCTVRVLRHESSLQPPLPMYMESLLRFLSFLISLIFQRLFKIKVEYYQVFLTYAKNTNFKFHSLWGNFPSLHLWLFSVLRLKVCTLRILISCFVEGEL